MKSHSEPKRSGFIDASDPPRPVHTGKCMKFKLVWHHPHEKKEVTESYEKETDNPEQYCKDLLDWFNSTLRPGERKRLFVRCEVEGEVPPAEHKWRKTTAMTQTAPQSRGGAPYDKMHCERCGITGKRFGIQNHVHRDYKFKLKVFARCDTSITWLAKKREAA